MATALRGAKDAVLYALKLTTTWGFAALTLDVLWGVVSRYCLGSPSRWTEEVAIYLLVWISLLGASLAYAERAHLGVDYIVQKLEPSARRLAHRLAELCVFVFSAWVMLYGGLELVFETLAAGQISPALGIPMGYVYLATPLSGAFLCAFAGVSMLRGPEE